MQDQHVGSSDDPHVWYLGILMVMIKRLIGMENDLYGVFCFLSARHGYHVSCCLLYRFYVLWDRKDGVGLT